jgi:hypothetical protein
VRKLLGHKSINKTPIYTQLVEFEGDEYCSAVATSVDEAKKLIEAGFEYICNHENVARASASSGGLFSLLERCLELKEKKDL